MTGIKLSIILNFLLESYTNLWISMLYGIGFFCLFCASLFCQEHVYLKTPDISQSAIIGTTVGVRPFRKTGVRIEAELLRDKLIIHNYGYGGSGLTLSFGGAHEVLEILDNQKMTSKTVAILGAGVIGLTTAYDLLEKGYDVHLYSDQWSPNLTSNVAAGIWSPLLFPSDIPEEKKKLHQRMLEIAERRFLKSTSDDPEFLGVKLMRYYRIIKGNPQKCDDVLVHFDNGLIKNCRTSYRLGIDGNLFMEDLHSKIKNKGAILKQKHFDNLEDILNLKEQIIVNCLSLGSRELFNDQEFIPIRGQMVYFKPQDDIDYVLSQGIPDDPCHWFAIYPWSNRIILGGVDEKGEEELKINPETIDKIIKNAEKCFSGEL